ncbi:MAG: LptF/LptG family permease [Fimbriimonas ginsengisoli]|uniref:LptF/LptG family permease n=1 Tax=Fimbriimonas ginsengisoli TaxID=1005039 RepID=A0A931PW36_FIMGI|nr:LptF/LptG family permease [Fimbriimonas ginsengisoli]
MRFLGLRQIDRLVIQELVGPWLFGVAMFTVLIVAATYLFRLTDYVVHGVATATVLELTALIIPSVMVKTFAMAVLLATLLAFGRFSSDSEGVALRASGASVYRMMRPVALFAFLVAAIAFALNETLVPTANIRFIALQADIAKKLDVKAMQPAGQPIYQSGRLVGQMMAADFNLRTQTLREATVVAYDKRGHASSTLQAKELEFDSAQFEQGGGWRIRGGATLTSADGRTVIHIDDQAWPREVPRLNLTPENLLAARGRDTDSFSMTEVLEQIRKAKAEMQVSTEQIANLEYGYWNKIALPLAAIVYGLLGAPLGIRGHRTGTAVGFALSIAIIFGYVTLANLMNVYAMGGQIPPYLASFSPLAIGSLFAGVIMWRRNL